MILLADSGSTKTDWVILDESKKQHHTFTIGFNPVFHSTESVVKNIGKNTELSSISPKVAHVYFYGAGCSSTERKLIISNALETAFPKAKITVGHDLEAAVFSSYRGKPNITCILGTGANSCFFDGKTILEKTPALGFILGDEASGAYFGKKLVTAFLYGNLPKLVAEDFKNTYALSLNQIVNKVYTESNPNVFLASLAPFVSKHISVPVLETIVLDGMRQFLTQHVLCFDNAKEIDIQFVGSIAHHFEIQLKQIAAELGLTIGLINQKPISGLVDYHLKYVLGSHTK